MIISRKNSIAALKKRATKSKSDDILKQRKKNVCREGNLVYLDRDTKAEATEGSSNVPDGEDIKNHELFNALITGLDLINSISKSTSDNYERHVEKLENSSSDNDSSIEANDDQMNEIDNGQLNDLMNVFNKNGLNIMMDYAQRDCIALKEYIEIHSLPIDLQVFTLILGIREYLESDKRYYVDMGLRLLNGLDFVNSVRDGELSDIVNLFIKR